MYPYMIHRSCSNSQQTAASKNEHFEVHAKASLKLLSRRNRRNGLAPWLPAMRILSGSDPSQVGQYEVKTLPHHDDKSMEIPWQQWIVTAIFVLLYNGTLTTCVTTTFHPSCFSKSLSSGHTTDIVHRLSCSQNWTWCEHGVNQIGSKQNKELKKIDK